MGLRPGRCYTKVHRPNTRQATHVPRKGYVKGVPKPKITVFEQGKKGEYDKKIFLLSQHDIQIRHNALESARVVAVQCLEKKIGKSGNYFFRVRVYPHHVIRENAMATGAGADRFQQGMRHSFGKPIGTAAQVRSGQKLLEVRVNNAFVNIAKLALKKARYKLPTTCKIIIE
ncbi:MAG: 50S ribosomal protein L16 [Candidatus Aenigmarchaeota archaeon]|nr:50S ribosomal protein L16 [Candidatus Aenigmarchaeota archaeon]